VYICEGISALRMYVTVASPYLRGQGVTERLISIAMKKGEKSNTIGGAGKEKAAAKEKGKELPIVAGSGWTSTQRPPGSTIRRRWINSWRAMTFA